MTGLEINVTIKGSFKKSKFAFDVTLAYMRQNEYSDLYANEEIFTQSILLKIKI